jgi:hypothetical protein
MLRIILRHAQVISYYLRIRFNLRLLAITRTWLEALSILERFAQTSQNLARR